MKNGIPACTKKCWVLWTRELKHSLVAYQLNDVKKMTRMQTCSGRHCEKRSDVAIQMILLKSYLMTRLPRFTRNDRFFGSDLYNIG